MHKRKSARPDQVDDPTAAVQAVGVQAAVETSVVVATQGLLLEHHLPANATAEARHRVDDHRAVLGPVATAVKVRLLGERTTGVGASATVVNADAVAQPRAKRARAAVAGAVVVVVAAAARITTRFRQPAASSTISKIGIRPSANPGSAHRPACRRAFGVAELLPSVNR